MNKKIIISCIILAVIFILCVSCSLIVIRNRLRNSSSNSSQNEQQKKITDRMNESYGSDQHQVYDFYAPEEEADTLMVIVHGGAWVLGDRSQFSQVASLFAKQGLSVINLDYRLAPAYQYDAPLDDITTVLNRVETKKADFKLKDNYKVVLLGHSAGAHLIALYCLKESDYNMRNIDYAIGLAGPYDLEVIEDKPGKILSKIALLSFLGDTPIADASPVNQVKENDQTKFLLVLGADDELVSSDQMYSFENALKAKNVYVETMLVEDRTHNTLVSMIPLNDKVAQRIQEFLSKD